MDGRHRNILLLLAQLHRRKILAILGKVTLRACALNFLLLLCSIRRSCRALPLLTSLEGGVELRPVVVADL